MAKVRSGTQFARDIRNAIEGMVWARLQLRGVRQGARVRCYGRVIVEGREGVRLGSQVLFQRGMFPVELRCGEGAELIIGNQTMFNYGVSICASRKIQIGTRCMFGTLVHVRDHDGRRTAPVMIGDDVWIAHGATIEPGSTLGDRSVVSAGSVVMGTVPPGTLAVGNPAKLFPLEPIAQPRPAAPGNPSDCGPAPLSQRPNGSGHADGACAGQHSGGVPDKKTPIAPTRELVREAIIEWLDDTRHFGEAAALVTSDSVSLRERGILDSIGLVELVVMLEDRFHVSIDRQLLSRPESQTLGTLLDLVAHDS